MTKTIFNYVVIVMWIIVTTVVGLDLIDKVNQNNTAIDNLEMRQQALYEIEYQRMENQYIDEAPIPAQADLKKEVMEQQMETETIE